MSKYDALYRGTLTFIAIALSIALFGQVLRCSGRCTKGDARLLNFFVFVAAVVMWMMWIMVWLSQANPILFPEVQNHTSEEH